jgi:phosphodiesterase/alkaline phosphatase D-like protein
MTAQDALEVLIQITGYPTSVKQKIDQFRFQLSTQPDFSTFASAIYRYTQGAPVLCDDEVSLSMNFNFKSLTPGTTYYFRARAENETGVSPYVSTSFTKS